MINYLSEKDIIVINKLFKYNNNYSSDSIRKQIIVGNAVHNILMAYPSCNETRINSIIGKKIEGIKVEVKRTKEDYKKIIKKKDLNICEVFLLDNGKDIIKKAEEAIYKFKEINFLEIVERSMKKNELCIGRIDEGNLRVMDRVEIGTIKNLFYNLVEEDIYEYLRRIRRKRVNVDINNITEEYINISKLSDTSRRYINILLEVPCDTLRQWRKFRNNKKNLPLGDYLESISNSYNYEFN